MSAVVSESRAKSTWLTGTVGLLVLAAAFVMMVIAAPRTHAPHHPTVTSHTTRGQLTSWVWSTPDHRVRVTPANASALTRAGRAPKPWASKA